MADNSSADVTAKELAQLAPEFTQAVEYLRKNLPENLQRPLWGIVCGSGLAELGNQLLDKKLIEYNSIPGFSHSTVPGHRSALAFGFLEQEDVRVPVVAALGRFHIYEGHSPDAAVFPVRVMRCMGAKAVVLTNAAGGLNPEWPVGTIMNLHDHIGLPTLTSLNPLIGPSFALGTRFPPLSDAYDPILRLALFKAARILEIDEICEQGTYAFVSGPTYESRAESRYLRHIGADAVGMSTVPEVIAAHQAGMRVLAISLITNEVVVKEYFDAKQAARQNMSLAQADKFLQQDHAEAANHEEVLEVGRKRAEDVRALVEHVICHTPI